MMETQTDPAAGILDPFGRIIDHADQLSTGQLAQVLDALAQAKAAADMATEETCRAARAAGMTWEQIGHFLGVTRQAAWERYSSSP